MTETLKNALAERADAVSFAPVDLGSIHRDGDRALRRRRAVTAGGALVAASLVVVAALTVSTGGDTTREAPIARDPGQASTADVTWVEGSTLFGDADGPIDLGLASAAYVRTSVGYVFAAKDGRIFSAVDGDTTWVGVTDRNAIRLVSDPAGPRAAWLDQDGTTIVTYDQASGADLRLMDRVQDTGAELTALDGSTAYLSDGRESFSVDLVEGTVTAVADDGSRVLDAAGTLLALQGGDRRLGEDGNDQSVRLVGPDESLGLDGFYGTVGTLSTDGTWYSGDADQPQVVATSTGELVAFDVPPFFATGYEWLDDSTLAMIAQTSENAPVELLTCRVPEGSCQQVAELGTFEEMFVRSFQLPTGVPTT